MYWRVRTLQAMSRGRFTLVFTFWDCSRIAGTLDQLSGLSWNWVKTR